MRRERRKRRVGRNEKKEDKMKKDKKKKDNKKKGSDKKMRKDKEREKTAEKAGETYHCENLADIVVDGRVHWPAHLDDLAIIVFARGKVLENDAVRASVGYFVICRIHEEPQHYVVDRRAVVLDVVSLGNRLLGIRPGSLNVDLADKGTQKVWVLLCSCC